MYIDVHDIPTKGSDSDNSKTLSELEDSIFHNSSGKHKVEVGRWSGTGSEREPT